MTKHSMDGRGRTKLGVVAGEILRPSGIAVFQSISGAVCLQRLWDAGGCLRVQPHSRRTIPDNDDEGIRVPKGMPRHISTHIYRTWRRSPCFVSCDQGLQKHRKPGGRRLGVTTRHKTWRRSPCFVSCDQKRQKHR